MQKIPAKRPAKPILLFSAKQSIEIFFFFIVGNIEIKIYYIIYEFFKRFLICLQNPAASLRI